MNLIAIHNNYTQFKYKLIAIKGIQDNDKQLTTI